jgi:hypothetical protein
LAGLKTVSSHKQSSKFHTLLILGRVSNLPTVWSNCLAGWWLGGGGDWSKLVWLCFGTTFLYVGGMFLNDAFDAEFDRQHRAMRPIPCGAISEKQVWQWGIAWMVLGAASLVWIGKTTGILTVILIGCILVYDAVHKLIAVAPLLMAACRLLLYLVAASAALNGVTGPAVWSGLALAAYILGLSYLARKESTRGALRYWPMLFLALPVALALLMNDEAYQQNGLLLSLVVSAWILWCLRQTLWRAEPKIGYTVSRLLAGIALIDLLAVADLSQPWMLLFLGWFVLSLLLQRSIPAT